MAEVALRQVVKKYGDVEAVRSIDLDIPNNEFVVLVGPSGCGKTTTLRMIAGLEEITSGDISIGGEVVNDLPPKDRDIAMVFQNYALYPHMTVAENLGFGLKLRGHKQADIERRELEERGEAFADAQWLGGAGRRAGGENAKRDERDCRDKAAADYSVQTHHPSLHPRGAALLSSAGGRFAF